VNANEFVVRQVTSLGNATFGAAPIPLGVINDRLLFVARENNVSGLYRTDGTNVELIDNSIAISTSEVAQFGSELYFAATAADGQELYATDGESVRQVTDLALGPLDSHPRDFYQLNDQLLFRGITEDASLPGGAPIRFFHTDGTTVKEFPYTSFSPSGSVQLGNRLVFHGFPPGGGHGMVRATDGEAIFDIPMQGGNSSPLPPLTKVDDHAYYVSGEGVERGVYRTDSFDAERIATFDSFTNLDSVVHSFENNGGLVFTMEDRVNDELIFYRTFGETPTEVTRWSIPDGFFFQPQFDLQPEFSDGSRAYFTFRDGNAGELYVFDGSTFSLLRATPSGAFGVTGLDGRVFVNEFGDSEQLYEVTNGQLTPIGHALSGMFEFQGDIFGWNDSTPRFPEPHTLWQIENGQLRSLGNVMSRATRIDGRFVEFRGQLYFQGQTGANQQLYALVPVPEASSMILASIAAACLTIGRRSPKRRRIAVK
jgi:ELWxxDGT repeat protein